MSSPAIPLARWADRHLRLLAEETGSPRIAALTGDTIVGERGSNGDYTINGRISAGLGGSRLMPTRDGGWFALTLIRTEDRELLPALFLDDGIDVHSPEAIAAAVAQHDCADLVMRGRLLGLPVASADEAPASPPVELLVEGPHRQREPGHVPLVVDLSAIWAGPLAGHLFWLAGAEVVKVESRSRPDLIRRDDPATFDLINQGKASVMIDMASDTDKAALVGLIRRADFVIESSRVRALKQLGIDAEALVKETPGLVWLSVTGHGASGDAAMWTGIGNDCAVAGGLARALADASGTIGYVGDAIADPLTGITGALEAWRAYRSGTARRIGLAMSAITARALAEERAYDPALLRAELLGWAEANGQPFPKVPRRALAAEVRELGADTAAWLAC
ncbi:CoA transferase [Novosphingobium sp. JCM 18896]|uniref:CoA transferase n=1 Tax=Novosphingobium sp. JCM 18896 TaxID=2989731 RepID=UPI002223699C|nr:CoA transferase [Novosphingobium sp. JCM 18896]MCW1431188.1 CoA transferase [Novosphingobium sp. JCM 18896]